MILLHYTESFPQYLGEDKLQKTDIIAIISYIKSGGKDQQERRLMKHKREQIQRSSDPIQSMTICNGSKVY